MNKRNLDNALKKANNAQNRMNTACEEMAEMFQPYFDSEISVLHQMGDGFVVLYNTDRVDGYLNDPVYEVFENVKKDKDYYR